MVRYRAPLLLLLMSLIAMGCGGEEGAVFEASGKDWQPAPLDIVSIDGVRDGEKIRVTYLYGGAGDAVLEMELVVVVDPRPSLDTGSWFYRGPTGQAEGTVAPKSLKFLGGQGGAPSVGGTFILNDGGKPRFKVVLPPTPVRKGYGG